MASGEKNYPMKGDNQNPAVSLTGIELDTYRVYRPGDSGGHSPEAGGGGGDFSMRDILYTLFRHKWKILTSFVLFSLLGAWFVSIQRDFYTSEARLMVQGGRAELGIDPSASGENFLQPTRGRAEVRNEIAILQSRALAEDVVDTLGPERVLRPPAYLRMLEAGYEEPVVETEPLLARVATGVGNVLNGTLELLNLKPAPLTDREIAINVLMKNLEIQETMSGSNVIAVRYTARNPEQAQFILENFVDRYQLKHIEVHSSRLSPDFFREEAQRYKEKLEVIEDMLDQRRKELDVASLELEIQNKLSEINSYDIALRETEGAILALEARMRTLKRALDAPEDESDETMMMPEQADPSLEPIRARLFSLRAEEIDLLRRYKENSREVRDIREQIKELESLLTDQSEINPAIRRSMNPQRLQMQADYNNLRGELEAEMARRDHLRQNLDEAKRKNAVLLASQSEFITLERQRQELEDKYRRYEESAQTTQIQQDLDRNRVGNVSVLQAATLPIFSEKNMRKMLAFLAFSVFLGLAGGIGLAFGLEFFDHSFKTSEEIEKKLGLPVLVAIPHMRGHRPEVKEETA